MTKIQQDSSFEHGGLPVRECLLNLRTITCFGPAAGAAAVPVSGKLSMEESILPSAILEALAAMGPAARSLLGRLEQFRKQVQEDSPPPDLAGPRPNQSLDPVGWTIWAIQDR